MSSDSSDSEDYDALEAEQQRRRLALVRARSGVTMVSSSSDEEDEPQPSGGGSGSGSGAGAGAGAGAAAGAGAGVGANGGRASAAGVSDSDTESVSSSGSSVTTVDSGTGGGKRARSGAAGGRAFAKRARTGAFPVDSQENSQESDGEADKYLHVAPTAAQLAFRTKQRSDVLALSRQNQSRAMKDEQLRRQAEIERLRAEHAASQRAIEARNKEERAKQLALAAVTAKLHGSATVTKVKVLVALRGKKFQLDVEDTASIAKLQYCMRDHLTSMGIDANTLQWRYKGELVSEIVHIKDLRGFTPQGIELEALVPQDEAGDDVGEGGGEGAGAGAFVLKVRVNKSDKDKVELEVDPTHPLSELVDKFCAARGVARDKVKFKDADLDPLDESASAQDLDYEGGEMLEATILP